MVLVLLSACATTGPNSPSAKPVLYPNATLTRVGEAQGRVEADNCMAKAAQAGLSPDQKTNEVGRRAGEGAAVAGVASVVGALITGRGSDVLRAGATGRDHRHCPWPGCRSRTENRHCDIRSKN